MRLMIEVQCETRVAETILGRSRVCNGANSGRLASILVNSCQHDRNCLFLKTCLFFFRSHLPSSWVFVGLLLRDYGLGAPLFVGVGLFVPQQFPLSPKTSIESPRPDA